MKPGPELDALIAEKVMGLKLHIHRYYGLSGKLEPSGPYLEPQDWGGSVPTRPKPYSTDIAAAWRVVERLRELGWIVDLFDEGRGWSVSFERDRTISSANNQADALTAPHAICLAAMKAFGGV